MTASAGELPNARFSEAAAQSYARMTVASLLRGTVGRRAFAGHGPNETGGRRSRCAPQVDRRGFGVPWIFAVGIARRWREESGSGNVAITFIYTGAPLRNTQSTPDPLILRPDFGDLVSQIERSQTQELRPPCPLFVDRCGKATSRRVSVECGNVRCCGWRTRARTWQCGRE